MAATFDPTGHPLLSDAAAALSAEELDAQARVAEIALGLRGLALSDEQAEDARLAVVRQVNAQLAIDEAGGANVVSESKGSQSYTYAQRNGERMLVDRLAWSIARSLTDGPDLLTSTSHRTQVTW